MLLDIDALILNNREKEKAKKIALEKKLVEKVVKEMLTKEQDEERQRAIEAEVFICNGNLSCCIFIFY